MKWGLLKELIFLILDFGFAILDWADATRALQSKIENPKSQIIRLLPVRPSSPPAAGEWWACRG
jgi:hypothetical protein